MTQKKSKLCVLQKISSRGAKAVNLVNTFVLFPPPILCYSLAKRAFLILFLGVLHNFRRFMPILGVFTFFFWGKNDWCANFYAFCKSVKFMSWGRCFARTHPVCRLPCATPGPCPDLVQFHVNHDLINVGTNRFCTARKGLKFLWNLQTYFCPQGRIKHDMIIM